MQVVVVVLVILQELVVLVVPEVVVQDPPVPRPHLELLELQILVVEVEEAARVPMVVLAWS